MLPAHESGGVDLVDAETGFNLLEVTHVLKDVLSKEIRDRVAYEVDRRLIQPYLMHIRKHPKDDSSRNVSTLLGLYAEPEKYPGGYHTQKNNWNGVCNSSMGACFLYLENNNKKLASALNSILKSLSIFIDAAFTEDGASDEGVGYWAYGLINFVAFSELLRAKTGKRVNLLDHPKIRKIAAYPAKMQLSPGHFYSHSDSKTKNVFHPGFLTRLAERSKEPSLLALVQHPKLSPDRFSLLLRDYIWAKNENAKVQKQRKKTCLLASAGIFRLDAGPWTLAGKAGHNAENHNHNDVGSFVLHAGGEDFFCDPGAPPYDKNYFRADRYKKYIQAMSSGHSVPVIGGRLQEHGEEYRGDIVSTLLKGRCSSVVMELSSAYADNNLSRLRRTLKLSSEKFILEDQFEFLSRAQPIEECFVTFLPVRLGKRSFSIIGKKFRLLMKISSSRAYGLRLEKHSILSGRRNLNRVLIKVGAASALEFRISAELKG